MCEPVVDFIVLPRESSFLKKCRQNKRKIKTENLHGKNKCYAVTGLDCPVMDEFQFYAHATRPFSVQHLKKMSVFFEKSKERFFVEI